MRGRVLTVLAVIAVLAVPAAAYASHVIDSKSGSGDYAIVIASGSANHPRSIAVRITSRPAQHVRGSWTMVCSRGFGAGSKSGNISGTGTFRRTLKMPSRRPDDCTVSASAQLDRGGRIRVTLVAG